MITEADIENLRMQLDKYGNGATQHIAGKARNYLAAIEGKPNAKFSNCTADEFVQHVKNALYKGEWKQLENLMARWW